MRRLLVSTVCAVAVLAGAPAALAQEAAGLACLAQAGFGQGDVGPAGETVLQVPLALAVADEDYSLGHLQQSKRWIGAPDGR